jgi:phosphatidylglycerol---prolipoprotein diacylglyceryl transferase
MYPILFTIGGLPVYSYGLFFFLALLTGFALLIYEARRRRWPREEVIPITLTAFVGGMIGARVSIFFFNGIETANQTLNLFSLFDPRVGPGSILGAVAGAYLGGYVASKAIGKAGCACDAFAPAMALAMGIGRIGAFLAGVDGLGKPTTVPWGVTLPGVEYAVHPTPLYDAGFNFIWFTILMLLRDHPNMQNGNLLKFGLGGYALVRFFIEFARTNQVVAWGLTGQQFFCLFLLLALGVYYFRQWKNQNRLISV